MDDLANEFRVKIYEKLDPRPRLPGVGDEPRTNKTLGSIFRAVHTINGTGSLLGFSNLESVAYAAESLMISPRGGALQANRPIIDALKYSEHISPATIALRNAAT